MLAAPALAQTPPPRSISVTGEANVSAPPDVAEIDGGVTTDAKTAREASQANARAMTAVMAALKTAGVAERDIRTSRLSIFPQMTSGGPGTAPRITGYRASNRVTVKTRDLAKLSDMVDAMVAAGANEMGGIRFIVSEPSPLLDKARTEAIEDARRKAEIFARAAGVTLGAPLAISEEGASPPVPVYRMDRVAAAPMATPVSPGEQTLRLSVNVSWEIAPK